MDAGVIILEVVYSFALLLDMLLVVIGEISDALKELIHILHGLSTHFDVFESLPGVDPIHHGFLVIDLPLACLGQVSLVTNDDYRWHQVVKLLFLVLVDESIDKVALPLLDAFVTLPVSDVIYDHAAISSSVKRIA